MDQEIKNESNSGSEARIPAVRTYRSDVEEAVHDQGASLASIMLAEKKHQEEISKDEEIKSVKSSIVYSVISIILILGAIIAVYVFRDITKKASTAQIIEDQLATYISYDKVTHINADGVLGKEATGKALNSSKKQTGKAGEIEVLSVEKGTPAIPISTSEFFNILGSNIPSNILNSFEKNMMIGIYTTSNLDRHMFMIFGVKDYDRALTGTLEWEKTILDDLFTIYNINITEEYSSIMQAQFEDIVINNKNARVIRDINGLPALYILFVNKDLLIITDNEETIQEITNRNLVRNAKPL